MSALTMIQSLSVEYRVLALQVSKAFRDQSRRFTQKIPLVNWFRH